MSACWNFVGQYSNSTSLLVTYWRSTWYLTWICFVLLWSWGFFVSAMHAWLSSWIITTPCGNPKSDKSCFSQMISFQQSSILLLMTIAQQLIELQMTTISAILLVGFRVRFLTRNLRPSHMMRHNSLQAWLNRAVCNAKYNRLFLSRIGRRVWGFHNVSFVGLSRYLLKVETATLKSGRVPSIAYINLPTIAL